MKILIAGETYFPDVNGAAVFSQRLASGLANRGHEVHVVVPSPEGHSFIHDLGQTRVHRVPSFRYPWHASFYIADFRRVGRSVRQIIEDVEPDVVHIQAHFVVGRAAARGANELGIPWIATNHFMPENLRTQFPLPIPDLAFEALSTFAWRDAARVWQRAQAITAPTHHAVELLRVQIARRTAIPISCGVDVDAFDDAAEREGPPTILFVGRLDAEKHVDELISAVARLEVNARLRVIGTGSQEGALRRQALRMGIAQQVEFLGYIDDERLKVEYEAATVFCMPGTAELQSIATLEAMAASLPIVAANAHALPELVKPGLNGELYTPGDVTGLAAALDRVLSDDTRRSTYRSHSRRLVLQHNISRTIDSFEQLYLRISESRVRR